MRRRAHGAAPEPAFSSRADPAAMDALFPRTFLLVFAQLAVGGFFCLSVPPFLAMERGYYKSSAFVFWLLGGLALAGDVILWWRLPAPPRGGVAAPEILLWLIFWAAGGGYLTSLWGERVHLRARLFAATWLSGFAALIAAAQSYHAAPLLSVETLFYPAAFVLDAMVLGASATGMLLGHWYLIDRDLSLEPLWAVLRLYLICLALQLAALAFGCAALALLGTDSSATALHLLGDEHLGLLAARLAVSPLGGAVLGAMIRRTLQIPQTMAATGLFYIAVLAAIVGEFMGRFLLFRTGLPL
jgi:DMSO reductase anchor subunit